MYGLTFAQMESIHEGYLVKSPLGKTSSQPVETFSSEMASTILSSLCSACGQHHPRHVHGHLGLLQQQGPLHRKQGSIDLTNCVEVLAQLDASFYQNVFGLQTKHKNKDRTYYLVAETEQEMNDWVSALCWVLGMKENFEQQQQSFFPVTSAMTFAAVDIGDKLCDHATSTAEERNVSDQPAHLVDHREATSSLLVFQYKRKTFCGEQNSSRRQLHMLHCDPGNGHSTAGSERTMGVGLRSSTADAAAEHSSCYRHTVCYNQKFPYNHGIRFPET